MVTRFTCVLCLMIFQVSAQSIDYIRPGMLKSSATISPSTMLSMNRNNIYISGFLEYHLDKKLSIRGESFVFVDENKEVSPYFNTGLKTFFGVFYHLNKNNFDQHFGFEPGIAITGVDGDLDMNGKQQYSVTPSFALHAGASYYVWKYFHFFADVSYVRSRLPSRISDTNADELIFSFGLGYQIQTKERYGKRFSEE